MEERARCAARMARDGQFFKFRDKNGEVVRKRCFMEFRCEFFAFKDGLCRNHLEKKLVFEQGGYDHRHPMKNWAGTIGFTWPDEHAPFYGSPEYLKIISQGCQLSAEEEELCRKARMNAMGLAGESCVNPKSKNEESMSIERSEPMARPKKKGTGTCADTTTATATATTITASHHDSRPITELLKEPILFVTSRTPYKVKELEWIERTELEEYIRMKIDENPELKKLFTM